MAKVTGMRLPNKYRRTMRGGGRLMRSDNLRAAPTWITPQMVGRILALAMPMSGEAVPVTTVPTRGVRPALAIVGSDKKRIANPPVTHSRRPKEREAAVIAPAAASAPNDITSASVAAPVEPPAERHIRPAGEHGTAPHPGDAVPARNRQQWLADRAVARRAAADARIAADWPLFEIAFTRGISIADLARALEQNQATVQLHANQGGLRFGRRAPIAGTLTREQLLELADPAMPMPELRADRLKRERLAKSATDRRNKRAADVERRRVERAAAAQQRRLELDKAKAERRRQRELERAERQAAKVKKTKPLREAEKATVCRPVRPAPSREPAPLPPARAQSIIVRQAPSAPRYLNYAARITGAVAHLRARQFTVQRHDRDEIIARWHVSGWTGLFSNEQVIELALQHGLELRS